MAPIQAADVLGAAFPDGCWLTGEQTTRLREDLGSLGIVGGSVYDALVARAAAANDRLLLTRDQRAERTYRALDVPYRFVD